MSHERAPQSNYVMRHGVPVLRTIAEAAACVIPVVDTESQTVLNSAFIGLRIENDGNMAVNGQSHELMHTELGGRMYHYTPNEKPA